MSNKLIDFFYQRSDLIKTAIGFTPSNNNTKWVATFNFIVSNQKIDDDNTIELDFDDDLENTILSYYSDTDIDYKSKIIYTSPLYRDKKTFVHLILP